MEIEMVLNSMVQSSTPCCVSRVTELAHRPIICISLLDLFAPFWNVTSHMLGMNHIRGATPFCLIDVSFRVHHVDSVKTLALSANPAGEVVVPGSFPSLPVELPKTILVVRGTEVTSVHLSSDIFLCVAEAEVLWLTRDLLPLRRFLGRRT